VPDSVSVAVDKADDLSSLVKSPLAFTVSDIPLPHWAEFTRVSLYAAVSLHFVELLTVASSRPKPIITWSHTSTIVISIVFLERRYAGTAADVTPTYAAPSVSLFELVGAAVGAVVGRAVGAGVVASVGDTDGAGEGVRVGMAVGAVVGAPVQYVNTQVAH
jgi:hypothetical protein